MALHTQEPCGFTQSGHGDTANKQLLAHPQGALLSENLASLLELSSKGLHLLIPPKCTFCLSQLQWARKSVNLLRPFAASKTYLVTSYRALAPCSSQPTCWPFYVITPYTDAQESLVISKTLGLMPSPHLLSGQQSLAQQPLGTHRNSALRPST